MPIINDAVRRHLCWCVCDGCGRSGPTCSTSEEALRGFYQEGLRVYCPGCGATSTSHSEDLLNRIDPNTADWLEPVDSVGDLPGDAPEGAVCYAGEQLMVYMGNRWTELRFRSEPVENSRRISEVAQAVETMMEAVVQSLDAPSHEDLVTETIIWVREQWPHPLADDDHLDTRPGSALRILIEETARQIIQGSQDGFMMPDEPFVICKNEDLRLPDWCVVGARVKRLKDGYVGYVLEIFPNSIHIDPGGVVKHVLWHRRKGAHFEAEWQLYKEPPSIWERLGRDEL